MVDDGRDFWRCTVGAVFGLALAMVAIKFGFGAFLIAAALTILGGATAWFLGRILS